MAGPDATIETMEAVDNCPEPQAGSTTPVDGSRE